MKHANIVIGMLILLSNFCMFSCKKGIVYSEFRPVSEKAWNQDSALVFELDVPDTTDFYTILLHLRHTDAYCFQNMWMFVSTQFADFDSLTWQSDTIEFYLADDRGRWLGNGKNGLVEMPVLFEENYRFLHDGKYKMTVRQGMRDSLLRGVYDVGVEVMRTSNQKE